MIPQREGVPLLPRTGVFLKKRGCGPITAASRSPRPPQVWFRVHHGNDECTRKRADGSDGYCALNAKQRWLLNVAKITRRSETHLEQPLLLPFKNESEEKQSSSRLHPSRGCQPRSRTETLDVLREAKPLGNVGAWENVVLRSMGQHRKPAEKSVGGSPLLRESFWVVRNPDDKHAERASSNWSILPDTKARDGNFTSDVQHTW